MRRVRPSGLARCECTSQGGLNLSSVPYCQKFCLPCPLPLLTHEAAFHPGARVFLLQLRLHQPRVSRNLLEHILCDCALGLEVDPPCAEADEPQDEWKAEESQEEQRDGPGIGGYGVFVGAEDTVETVVTYPHFQRFRLIGTVDA